MVVNLPCANRMSLRMPSELQILPHRGIIPVCTRSLSCILSQVLFKRLIWMAVLDQRGRLISWRLRLIWQPLTLAKHFGYRSPALQTRYPLDHCKRGFPTLPLGRFGHGGWLVAGLWKKRSISGPATRTTNAQRLHSFASAAPVSCVEQFLSLVSAPMSTSAESRFKAQIVLLERPFKSDTTGVEWLKTERIVLVLCGLVASGKSTFSVALAQHFPEIVRCNQDELGRRGDVERLARAALDRGRSICIDRTNVDRSQRKTWVDLAREWDRNQTNEPKVPVRIYCIVFDTTYEVCSARIGTRGDHPTITSPAQGQSILLRFAQDFDPPTANSNEGFDRILYLQPMTTPIYTRSDLVRILNSVRNAKPATKEEILSNGDSGGSWTGVSMNAFAPNPGVFLHDHGVSETDQGNPWRRK